MWYCSCDYCTINDNLQCSLVLQTLVINAFNLWFFVASVYTLFTTILKKSGDQKPESLSFDIITSDYAGKAYDLAAGEIGMHTSFS